MSLDDLQVIAKTIRQFFPHSYATYLRLSLKAINETKDLLSKTENKPPESSEELDRLHSTWERLSSSLWLWQPTKEVSDIKHDFQYITSRTITFKDFVSSTDDLSSLLEDAENKVAWQLLRSRFLRDLEHALRESPINKRTFTSEKTAELWRRNERLSIYLKSEISTPCSRLCQLAKNGDLSTQDAKLYKALIYDVRRYLRLQRHISSNVKKVFGGFGFILLAVFLSLGLLPIQDIQDEGSEGDKSLVMLRGKENEDLERAGIDNSCLNYKTQEAKEHAVQAFKKYNLTKGSPAALSQLEKARKGIINYLRDCPGDSEAHIYHNNYLALIHLERMNFIGKRVNQATIAVVVPLSRSMGLSDSFDALRGVSFGQARNNREVFRKSTTNPIILIKIFDDRKVVSNVKDSTDKSVKSLAVQTAKSIALAKENAEIVGVLGHFSSPATEAASQIYSIYNFPVITPSSTNIRKPLQSCSYSWLGVRFPRVLNFLLLLTTDGYANKFVTHAEAFRLSALRTIETWDTSSNYLSEILGCDVGNKNDRMLDLAPNIFRMAPDDRKSQKKIVEYIGRINSFGSKNPIQQISMIYSASHGYSSLFKSAWERQTDLTKKSIKMIYCTIDNSSRDPDCERKITNFPGKQLLIVVPSSEQKKAFEAAVTDIMHKHKNRQLLHIIGSDSMLTWSFKKSIYNGFVITSAARPMKKQVLISGQSQSFGPSLDFNWRAQLSSDAISVFSKNLSEAFGSSQKIVQSRKLRHFILNNISSRVYANEFDDSYKFNKDDHQRESLASPQNFNVLLCLQNSNGQIGWRVIEDSDIICNR